MARRRLDAELVRRGDARSREHACELIAAGAVTVNGAVAAKPATQVEDSAPIVVRMPSGDPGYVSRGAHKLVGALDAFDVDPAGRVCLDAGASTGGFTDVLLRRGAHLVFAVDVGYGQLAWSISSDDRGVVMDRCNVRELQQLPTAPSLVVADLSFISLTLVLQALKLVADADAEYLLMVKPQFEVGKDLVGAGGVVRDPQLREQAVAKVVKAAHDVGLGLRGVVASPLPGPSGNVEYFVWLHQTGAEHPELLIPRAIEEGPT